MPTKKSTLLIHCLTSSLNCFHFFLSQKTLIEFLFLSKCLLIKSRRLLLDSAPQTPQTYSGTFDMDMYGPGAPVSPNIQSQRNNTSQNLLSGSNPSINNSSSSSNLNTGNSGGPSNNSLGPSGSKSQLMAVANPQLETNTIWQKEMEKGYDTLLEAILPFLGTMAANSRLQR
jgi:hypothetical protein